MAVGNSSADGAIVSNVAEEHPPSLVDGTSHPSPSPSSLMLHLANRVQAGALFGAPLNLYMLATLRVCWLSPALVPIIGCGKIASSGPRSRAAVHTLWI